MAAFVSCAMRSTCIAEVARTDQGGGHGQHDRSIILGAVLHIKGNVNTPRHQMPIETSHEVQLTNNRILLNAVCVPLPQESPSLLSILELGETAPRPPTGLNTFDVSSRRY